MKTDELNDKTMKMFTFVLSLLNFILILVLSVALRQQDRRIQYQDALLDSQQAMIEEFEERTVRLRLQAENQDRVNQIASELFKSMAQALEAPKNLINAR